jgi:diguanylate cyclase (GGDEF)-like protein/PAS domain S-box-containing protein
VRGIVINVRDVTQLRAAERERAAEHAFIDAVVDTVPTLVVVITPTGELVRMNRAAETLTGYESDEVRGCDVGMFLDPDELHEVEAVVADLRAGMFPNSHENHWVTRTGERRLISWTNTCLLGEDGQVTYVVGTGQDVTVVRRAEQAGREAEERFRVVFDHAPVGLALAAPDGRMLSVNQPLCDLAGREAGALVGATLGSLVAPGCVEEVRRSLAAVSTGDRARRAFELRWMRPDGAAGWLMLGLTLVRDERGEPLHFVAQLEDVTSEHEAHIELQRRALHDDLTGLPNRFLFLDRLDQAASRLQRSDAPMALLYLDLDGFKAVNDTYGHAAGDDLLRVVADRLSNAVRPADTVARLGGDEFAVLCEDLVDARHATVVSARLQTELERPIEVAGTTVAVGASIGHVIVGGPDPFEPAELLARADAAMYQVKQRGRREQARSTSAPAPAVPVPVDEEARLASLHSYRVLDTPHEEVFDDLVRLAAMICETPMAAISLVDDDRQWFKASVGLSVDETPRDVAFCAHALAEPDLLVVDDARTDERFCDNPMVTSGPEIRFYGGAPLRNEEDHTLGSLCVVDKVPRRLRPDQEEALRALGRQVMYHLEQRRRALAVSDRGAADGGP